MRRFIAVPLLLTALLASACGGGADIAAPPSSAPGPISSPPSPSSSPARESAKDFIRRWVRTSDAAQSGDLTAFHALNEPGCQSCAGYERTVRRIYAAGGSVEPAVTTILWIRKQPNGSYYVRERVTASRYREREGAPWKTFPGGTDTQIYYLVPAGATWLMKEYSQLAGSSR